MRRQRGFTMIEMIVALAVLGIVVMVMVVAGRQNDTYEKKRPLNLTASLPDRSTVIARVRRDVLDATSLPRKVGSYELDHQTLILEQTDRTSREKSYVVYDFTAAAKVRRLEVDASGAEHGVWETNASPRYDISIEQLRDTERYAVRLKGYDTTGNLVVDQLIAPRVNNGV